MASTSVSTPAPVPLSLLDLPVNCLVANSFDGKNGKTYIRNPRKKKWDVFKEELFYFTKIYTKCKKHQQCMRPELRDNETEPSPGKEQVHFLKTLRNRTHPGGITTLRCW